MDEMSDVGGSLVELEKPPAVVVHGLIWLPFTTMDPVLVKFARDFAPGKHAVTIVQGPDVAKAKVKVGTSDNILVVAHGNGVAMSNWETKDAKGAKDYGELQPDDLARLFKKFLPAGYTGTITLWSCQAARPWKHIPEAMQQLRAVKGVDLDEAGELSYVILLKDALELRRAQVQGPIGYITSDRPVAKAQVYASKEYRMLDKTIAALEGGIVNAGATPPDDFYKAFSKKRDKGDSSGDDGGGSSSETTDSEMDVEPRAQPAPAFKSKQEFLDSIVKNAPFGQGGPPPSLRERLEKTKKK